MEGAALHLSYCGGKNRKKRKKGTERDHACPHRSSSVLFFGFFVFTLHTVLLLLLLLLESVPLFFTLTQRRMRTGDFSRAWFQAPLEPVL